MVAEENVVAAFKSLGYSPRGQQVKTVTEIVEAFQAGKRHVFLDAPTGSGKSLIGLVVRQVLDVCGVVITATNALGEQYERDYPGVPLVMGAGQYPCNARRALFKNEATAEQCYRKSRFFYKLPVEPTACATCRFAETRKLKHSEPASITNYPYFIIDQLYVKPMPGGHGEQTNPAAYHSDLGIFDEAHLINEQFAQHYVIHYSVARGREFVSDIRKLIGPDTLMETAYRGVFDIIDENIKRGSIGQVNHLKFVNMLEKFYKKMMEICDTKKIYANVEASYDQISALHHKYHSFFCKIDDYKKYGYECVVEVKKAEGTLSIQPIFVGEASAHLLQKQNLFMSATLNYDFMVKTLALDPADCQLVRVEYEFNSDDKTIDFTKARSRVNYANMYSDPIIYSMRESIEEIMETHPDESGVVIATSFKMAEELSKAYSKTHLVILHRSHEPAREVIMRFKTSTVPTVLFSPSLFEGVDLPGIISSFQVLPKAPYLSLGSKRMFHISRKHRSVYLQMSIKRMIQGFGRSTRYSGDRSRTYVLDLNAEKLFRSKHNSWMSQFHVIR